jgi:hypothetical protein
MNATTLASPNWTTEVQRYSQKTIFCTPIVWGAFQSNIAPVLVETVKGLSLHWFESECYWRQRITNFAGITHNPLTASVSAAIAELTSVEAMATYSRIRHIIRETATDALVIGLCGVVAIAEGIELAQKVYRQAKAAYIWVDAKLNPAGPGPMILPTVEMAIAPHQESAFQQEELLEDIQALIAEDEEYEHQFMARLKRLDADALATVQDEAAIGQDEILQPNGFGEYVPVTSPIANPEPHDIHQEVQERLAEIHSVTVDAPAEDFASLLEVPGAKGKRTSKAKGGTRNSGDKASAPKSRRMTAKK